jgi:23S rRNA (adenine2030-N6)-methyltransferase
VNYRHAYHAGGIADLVKHAILMLLIERLKAKEKPWFLLDTHAGIGLYDLSRVEALKTGEFQAGIGTLADAASPGPILSSYLELVRQFNTEPSIRFYPGSPAIAAALKRPEDRLVFCELHPEDQQILRNSLPKIANASFHHGDGYAALKAFLPPAERRGLVLIDPPFEDRNEFRHLIDAMTLAWKRWPTGQYALWYPIKDRPQIDRFHAELGIFGKVLAVEFLPETVDEPEKLNGSGLILINPPWQIDEKIEALLDELKLALDRPAARTRVCWLAE